MVGPLHFDPQDPHHLQLANRSAPGPSHWIFHYMIVMAVVMEGDVAVVDDGSEDSDVDEGTGGSNPSR